MAVVDLDKREVVAVNRLADTQPDIPPALKQLALEIATRDIAAIIQRIINGVAIGSVVVSAVCDMRGSITRSAKRARRRRRCD